MHNIEHRPHDAQVRINGLWYKIGLRGMPFVWITNEWIRSSSKTAAEVERQKTRNPDGTFA